MKRTVFISSTFTDLKKHRKKVWDILTKYEVNIRGMEQFGARKESPLETCISEVEQSDVFVGIIGFRLGSIEKKSGKSFTQLEYEKALELDKEILIYFLDEKHGELKPVDVDFGLNQEKLSAFKSILKERHTIDYFINENDLALKLDRKFKELLTSKEKEGIKGTNKYKEIEKAIKSFLILPKAYNGLEIKLKIKKSDEPFAASKAICESFNLDYGKTFVQPIKTILPKLNEECFEYLFGNFRQFENIQSISNETEFEVYAELYFTEEIIYQIRANFYPTYKTKIVENPNYNPFLPESNIWRTIATANLFTDNRKHIEVNERIEGEGRIIILLKDIV
jgi:hypothetical protein